MGFARRLALAVCLAALHPSLALSAPSRPTPRPDPPPREHLILKLKPGNRFLAGCERLGSITCDGTRQVGLFWSAALGWPLVWDQDEETAIRAPDGSGPLITWGGPPLPAKNGTNRLHLEVAPTSGDHDAEVERLLSLGASRVDIDQGDVDRVVMADPDGNEFVVLSAP